MNSTSAEPAVSRHITLHLMVAVNFVLSTFNGSKVALKVIVSITATGTGLSWVFRISMGRVWKRDFWFPRRAPALHPMSQPSICLLQQVHRPSPWRTQRSQSMSRHVKTGIILSKYLCQIILQLPSALKDPERLLEGSLASSHLCAILPMYIMCPCVRVNTLNCIDMRTQTYNTTPRQTIPYPTLPYLTRLTSLTLPYLPIHTHNITLHCIALHHITSHQIAAHYIPCHMVRLNVCSTHMYKYMCLYMSVSVYIYIIYVCVCGVHIDLQ